MNMTINFLSVISYVFISTFTPGPSNISSASMAVLHSYRKTLKYQMGLASGVFLLMFLSGWFSTALLNLFPSLEPILRYVGAGYILYLAFGILKASYTFVETNEKPLEFTQGLMLNVLNPKLYVYAFTLFTAFLSSMKTSFPMLVIVCLLLAVTSFGATSTWALSGSAIKRYLQSPKLKIMVNVLLALMLVYAAISLVAHF
jgi:cysteine/O-acetylserine efflux protein